MIRDPVKYCAALWDWDFLKPCFNGTAIRVADLDGLLDDEGIVQKHGYVERYGHHLLFETTVPDREMTSGQLRSHSSLVKVGFCVVYLWGVPNSFPIHKVQVWKEFEAQRGDVNVNVSEAGLVGWVCKWFRWSTQNPITPPLEPAFFDRAEVQ
ncbi:MULTISPECIES: hypothetical protein [Bradyrhizobium]|uniref:hypothetical protein n=1 Tax=Bradyrhizobium TaxID=374 RepID=UPI0004141B0A|nr:MULTISPECIES: hypothetical protein [Bradyrhizobium]TAI59827.1 hypothetical protein CWO89_44090 [Bradyrhizobium sp. Leo170]